MGPRKVAFYIFASLLSVAIMMLLFVTIEIGAKVILKTWPSFRLVSSSDLVSIPAHSTKYQIFSSVKLHERYNSTIEEIPLEYVDRSKTYPPQIEINGGWVHTPNLQFQSVAKIIGSDKNIFNVTVTTDEYGRRKTPDGPSPLARMKHLIFIGCSFVFGEGVNDDETLPYFTGSLTKEYRAYNLGKEGGYAPESLELINKARFFDGIKEQQGLAIYPVIDDQMVRQVGKFRYLSSWLKKWPVAEKRADGSWVTDRTWLEARPGLVWASQIASQFSFLTLLNFDGPRVLDRDYRDYAEIIAEIKKRYLARFGSENQFIVLFYFEKAKGITRLIPYLEQLGISYLDYSGSELKKIVKEDPYILFHPTANSNLATARILIDDLHLK